MHARTAIGGFAVVALLVPAMGIGEPVTPAQEPLSLESKIPLGDVQGRIDHLAVDTARRRLYVAELGNNSVGVVDLGKRTVIRTLGGFREPQGIAYEAATDTVYVANGGDGSLRLLHGADLTPAGSIQLGADADNVRIDGAAHRVFVGYGSGALAVIDSTSRRRIADIPLKGHPESFQLEATGRRIFVNVPEAREVAIVERETNKQAAAWSTHRFRRNFPLAIDEARQRVLVMFRDPSRLGVFDIADGTMSGAVDACGDADDVFVDAKRSRVYVSCGEGFIDVFSAQESGYVKAGHVKTEAGARTALFVPELDRLLLAVRASAHGPAAIWVFRPNSPVSQVLFVCEHGNVKSLMATLYFNKLAQERGLPFRAVSRGSAPDSITVPPAITAGLRADGFDISAFQPAAVSATEMSASTRVITIGTALPATAQVAGVAPEQWNDVPPAGVDYGASRDSLEAHVEKLIEQLTHP